LLICTDHWSDLCTRPGGHPLVMTPTLAQLARSRIVGLGGVPFVRGDARGLQGQRGLRFM
jgi:hypothetical protein